jgi:hypothetical protein
MADLETKSVLSHSQDDQPGNEISYKSELIRSSKKHLLKFLDTTTVAGIKFVFVGKSTIRRIAWGVIFFCCTVGCIVNIAISFKRLLDLPTATTITSRTLSDSGLPFPAVTFCDLNYKRNYSNPLNNHTYEFLYHFFQTDQSYNDSTRHVFINKCRNNFLTNISGTSTERRDMWDYISKDLLPSDFVHSCKFTYAPFASVDCMRELRVFMTDSNICYTFNGIRNGIPDTYFRSTGDRYGLQVELNIDHLHSLSPNGFSGVKVVVHDRNDIPRPGLFGIGVPPGSNAVISVKKQTEEDQTLSKCTDDFYLPFLHDMVYSQYACYSNENMKFTADNCGCVIYSAVRPPSGPYANIRNCTFNDSCCLIEIFDLASGVVLNCPLVCSFSNYAHTVSYLSYPTGDHLDELVKQFNRSADDISKDFLSVHVFLEDLVVTKSVTEYTYQWNAFLADVGGHLGLFIGASIITVFEVAIFGMDMLKNILFPHKIKKHIKHIDKRMSLLKVDVVDDNGGSNGGSNAGSVEQLNGSTVQAIN